MGGRAKPPVPAVVVSPARDRSFEEHVRAGATLARLAANHEKRIALIASADHGHAHDEDGPYGFDPAAKEYDDRVVELVRENRLGGLLGFDPGFIEHAKADSFWQMLMLHGALSAGGEWRAEFLSYEAPTYFGMLCAAYERSE
jgi:aromatic ring-opening dioxygenase LigB subunit